ncbi:MAG: hypothetical protein D3922_01545 [Candidatus Electrothrix sp. AR1]|nr:hypothetical protein [Candidatus Electrothrix sp. AR1]
MKYLCSIVMLIAISIFLSGCVPKPVVPVTVDCPGTGEMKSGEIQVSVGDEFKLSLCSNITTGHAWSNPGIISDIDVIEQVDHIYKNPSFGGVGAGGEEVWTFKAKSKGQSTVSLKYRQGSEDDEQASMTYVLRVDVR